MAMVLSNFWNILMPVSVVVDTIDKTCNFYQELAKGQKYYIFNNNYPQNYSAGSSCIWTANSKPHSKIFLSCNDITMPKSPNCNQDRLEISSSGRKNLSESHKYCGEGSFSLVTQENILNIVLRTSTKSQGGRFLCSVVAIDSKAEEVNEFQQPQTATVCPPCGWKNDRRIVGGHPTAVNEYPAMAGIVDNSSIRRPYCGATIITNRFVLTAAHCVHNREVSNLYLLVGDHDISTGSDTAFSALYKILAYEMWDGYDSANYHGDIALMKVDKINFNENVGPICLPFRYSYDSFEAENVTALGWGLLEFSGAAADVLQEVDLKVIANSECQEEEAISSEMCTYTPDKDTCQFDSGGPLLWQNTRNKQLFLLGIISHGRGCASGSPGVNTRVTSFLEWIQRRTGD